MPKRVLFLAQVPPPFHGASYLNSVVLEAFEKEFFVIKIPFKFSDDLGSLGRLGLRKIFILFRFFFRLLSVCSTKKPDVCYFPANVSGLAFYRDFLISIVLKCFSIPIVFHLHGLGVREGCRSSFKRKLFSIMFNNSSVLCVSNKVKEDEFSNIRIPNVRLAVARNGIDGDAILRQFQPSLQPGSPPNRIVHISNLRESKGVFDVLRVTDALVKRGCNVQTEIAGEFRDEEFKNRCFKFIEERSLNDHVVFLGNLDFPSKFELLTKPCVFLYPTYRDSFGLVILESMLMGNPVVAYDEGSVSEIIENGESGIVVPKGDLHSLSNMTFKLISDGVLYSQLRKAGIRSVLKNFSLEEFKTSVLSEIRLDR